MPWYYIEGILNSPLQKLLELINKFTNMAGLKINTQKSAAFLNTNNKPGEREIKSIQHITSSKNT